MRKSKFLIAALIAVSCSSCDLTQLMPILESLSIDLGTSEIINEYTDDKFDSTIVESLNSEISVTSDSEMRISSASSYSISLLDSVSDEYNHLSSLYESKYLDEGTRVATEGSVLYSNESILFLKDLNNDFICCVRPNGLIFETGCIISIKGEINNDGLVKYIALFEYEKLGNVQNEINFTYLENFTKDYVYQLVSEPTLVSVKLLYQNDGNPWLIYEPIGLYFCAPWLDGFNLKNNYEYFVSGIFYYEYDKGLSITPMKIDEIGPKEEEQPFETKLYDISEAKTYDGRTVIIHGYVVASGKDGFLVQDSTGTIYVYTKTYPGVEMNDEVTVKGAISLYKNIHEMTLASFDDLQLHEGKWNFNTELDYKGIDETNYSDWYGMENVEGYPVKATGVLGGTGTSPRITIVDPQTGKNQFFNLRGSEDLSYALGKEVAVYGVTIYAGTVIPLYIVGDFSDNEQNSLKVNSTSYPLKVYNGVSASLTTNFIALKVNVEIGDSIEVFLNNIKYDLSNSCVLIDCGLLDENFKAKKSGTFDFYFGIDMDWNLTLRICDSNEDYHFDQICTFVKYGFANEPVKVVGAISFITRSGFIIYDGDSYIYVYDAKKTADLAIGDVVEACGNLALYQSIIEINATSIKKTDVNIELDETVQDFDIQTLCEIDGVKQYSFAVGKTYSYRGALECGSLSSGDDKINVYIDGSLETFGYVEANIVYVYGRNGNILATFECTDYKTGDNDKYVMTVTEGNNSSCVLKVCDSESLSWEASIIDESAILSLYYDNGEELVFIQNIVLLRGLHEVSFGKTYGIRTTQIGEYVY